MFKLTLVHKIALGLILVAVAIGACLVGISSVREQTAVANSTKYSFDYSWVDNNTYIAHAVGGGSGQHLH